MSQPPTYNRSASFTNLQAANPTGQPPGATMDVEYNAIKSTLDAILANLALIQRDDGALANASVGLNQLSSQVTVGFSTPTAWATGTGYVSSPASTVFHGTAFYSCLVSHTSGTFSTDLSAGKWVLIVDLSAIPLVDADQIAVTASGLLTTDVQSSLEALDAGKAATSHTHPSSAITDSTAAGRGLLTAANVAAQQTLLGLGSLAFLNSVVVTDITANLAFTGEIAPAALAANTNDWSPTNWATSAIVKLSASSPINITGLAATTNGDLKELVNVGANNITLTAQDALSAVANRFAVPRPLTLRPQQSMEFIYDGTSTLKGWVLRSPLVTSTVSGGFRKLKINWNSDTGCVITANACTVEDANGESARLKTVNVTIDTGTVGANGIDVGTLGNSTEYHAHVIYSPLTNTTAGLLSLSATAPTLPSGYTSSTRAGANFTTSGGKLNRVLQQGKDATYVISASTTTALPSLASSTQGTDSNTGGAWQAISVVGKVPSTAVRISIVCTNSNNNGSGGNISVAPNSNYSGRGTAIPPVLSISSTSVQSVSAEFDLESTNIYLTHSQTNCQTFCKGWKDNL